MREGLGFGDGYVELTVFVFGYLLDQYTSLSV